MEFVLRVCVQQAIVHDCVDNRYEYIIYYRVCVLLLYRYVKKKVRRVKRPNREGNRKLLFRVLRFFFNFSFAIFCLRNVKTKGVGGGQKRKKLLRVVRKFARLIEIENTCRICAPHRTDRGGGRLFLYPPHAILHCLYNFNYDVVCFFSPYQFPYTVRLREQDERKNRLKMEYEKDNQKLKQMQEEVTAMEKELERRRMIPFVSEKVRKHASFSTRILSMARSFSFFEKHSQT